MEDNKSANWLRLLPVILLLPLIMGALTLAEIIPYVGDFFQVANPVVSFFVLVLGGITIIERANMQSGNSTRSLVLALFLAGTLVFASRYIVGYYTYPVKVARIVENTTGNKVSYTEVKQRVGELLTTDVGGDGITSYAIYIERTQLTKDRLGDYVASQFDDVDDLGDIIGALINVLLHSIPILLKWLLCTKLNLISEPGYIGLIFWYLFNLATIFSARLITS